MARPRKNNAEYFSHDADMRNHRKVKAIENKFGIIGYAVWCKTLEFLCAADNNEVDHTDPIEKELIAADFGVSVTEMSDIWDFCVKLKLLQVNNAGKLHSTNLDERLSYVFEKRERAREAYEKAKKRQKNKKNKVSDTETEDSATETTQSKVNKSKVNKSKVNTLSNARARENSGQENFDSENSNLNEINETENGNGREVSKSFEIIESPLKKMREAWEKYAHNIAWNKFEIQALNEIFKSYKAIGARDPAEQFAQDIQARPEYLNEKGRLTPGYWARNFNSIHTEIHKSQNNEAGKSRKATHQIYDEQTADELAEQLATEYRNAQ